MQSKILSMLIVVSGTILMSGAIQNNSMAFQYSQQEQEDSYHDKMMMKPGSYAFGTIASLQNDKDGNPTWIVSGLYKGSVAMHNETEHGAAKGSLPNATLNAKFSMVMTNGSAMHDHEISDFTLTNISMPDNSTRIYNGTMTITMKQGPVSDVPISIKEMDSNAVSIWIDPTKINNHFGNTPIYGVIAKLLKVER
jgi:hypothetical protein